MKFYNQFNTIYTWYDIQQDDVWNIDEHGIGLGICINTCVFKKSGKNRTNVKLPENYE